MPATTTVSPRPASTSASAPASAPAPAVEDDLNGNRIMAEAFSAALLTYDEECFSTQVGLAERLGWPQSMLARLERGQNAPRPSTLLHLARTLGIWIEIDISPAGEIEVRFVKENETAVPVAS